MGEEDSRLIREGWLKIEWRGRGRRVGKKEGDAERRKGKGG